MMVSRKIGSVIDLRLKLNNKLDKLQKAVNEDPACLNVGSHRRSNQPNLELNNTMRSQRLLQS